MDKAMKSTLNSAILAAMAQGDKVFAVVTDRPALCRPMCRYIEEGLDKIGIIAAWNQAESIVRLPNGSVIRCQSNQAIRGLKIEKLWLDNIAA